MMFIYNNQFYAEETAVGILRKLEADEIEYQDRDGTVQDFLRWSMKRLSNLIPPRELDISPHLSDETLAFNYLCLLDSYRIGNFYNVDLFIKERK